MGACVYIVYYSHDAFLPKEICDGKSASPKTEHTPL